MNKTAKSQREQRIAYARRLIKFNGLDCINTSEVCDELMRFFGISRDSARTAVMHAVMRQRKYIIEHRHA